MPIRVALHHRTAYRYDRSVSLSPQVIRLRPAPHCRTPVLSYSLKVTPAKHFINWQQDPHGNFQARVVFPEPTRSFVTTVDLIAEMTVINPFDFFLEPDSSSFPFRYADGLRTELHSYLQPQPAGPRMQEFLATCPTGAERTVDFLVELNCRVHQSVKYLIRLEPGVQTAEQTLESASGSCRDSAWLLVQVLRNFGLAARFVSGYLIQLTPDVKSLDGPSGAESDFTDLHAWTEVYLPGAGWIGLDPTSGLLAGEGHLPLSATPEPSSAAPITGLVDECESEFQFEMSLQRIHEDPRVTKPYSDKQWTAIQQLGHQIDSKLEINAVRLTMGGEPTFVSIDDMDGAEWNTAALGAHKRRLAGDLFQRLAKRFAIGPLLHFGQGKWYPGESLPRWALGCYWRNDGVPIWNDPDYSAADDVSYGFAEADAQRFIHALAERLRVHAEHVLPAYEDSWYYLWKERRLPINVDPLNSNLSDQEERTRLAKLLERGLGRVVGYALPVRPNDVENSSQRWESGRWFFRAERMFLIPGDSPMGYRLPLDSIPWMAETDVREHLVIERDPFAARAALPRFLREGSPAPPHSMRQSRAGVAAREQLLIHQFAGVAADPAIDPLYESTRESPFSGLSAVEQAESVAWRPRRDRNGRGNGKPDDGKIDSQAVRPAVGESAAQLVRTALCVEPRDGRLHVFMPPLGHAEDYLALIAAIEQTAEAEQLPVRIEGYAPPHDHRLRHFKVTPDPGVIEVNLQPANHWDELVRNTTVLYEEARQARLGTEKFMLDGRHTGTGGGNHIVLGGATPADSPFLRRPDVLRSLVAYWNNRPSLSYLFSGLFIGPTSQAPRVDEARHESVYELEIALSRIADGESASPWLVDRILRHLLVDLTGNTHRAEFCIDKLFSPDSSSGRLGLVELRGFEMPPHARMSLAQQLLVRALVARFWQQPYRQPLVRWGTALHDRFMLPHFVAQDFAEVLEEMRLAGFGFESEWFAPHLEFRFPLCGEITQRGVQVELRQAIEPWHVLGEESGGGGTARFVDSSVERLQVKVRGLTDSRHVVTCNGRRVPLHPTGTQGEFVAGVRYRAWQPASCLHPTIGVHSPLVFDLLDTWNQRSLGGCTWHVSHPGGRSFDKFPVNSYEAESRRVARFFPTGHTPGPTTIPPREENADYPCTLDLRRLEARP